MACSCNQWHQCGGPKCVNQGCHAGGDDWGEMLVYGVPMLLFVVFVILATVFHWW